MTSEERKLGKFRKHRPAITTLPAAMHRIEELEDAIWELSANLTNVLHHANHSRLLLQELFTEQEFIEGANRPNKHGLMAEDLYHMLKKHFEPEGVK